LPHFWPHFWPDGQVCVRRAEREREESRKVAQRKPDNGPTRPPLETGRRVGKIIFWAHVRLARRHLKVGRIWQNLAEIWQKFCQKFGQTEPNIESKFGPGSEEKHWRLMIFHIPPRPPSLALCLSAKVRAWASLELPESVPPELTACQKRAAPKRSGPEHELRAFCSLSSSRTSVHRTLSSVARSKACLKWSCFRRAALHFPAIFLQLPQTTVSLSQTAAQCPPRRSLQCTQELAQQWRQVIKEPYHFGLLIIIIIIIIIFSRRLSCRSHI